MRGQFADLRAGVRAVRRHFIRALAHLCPFLNAGRPRRKRPFPRFQTLRRQSRTAPPFRYGSRFELEREDRPHQGGILGKPFRDFRYDGVDAFESASLNGFFAFGGFRIRFVSHAYVFGTYRLRDFDRRSFPRLRGRFAMEGCREQRFGT